jgi:hypothetical protein
MNKLHRPTKETFLKSLIVIGIFAIIGSLYIQEVKPYLKELSLRSQDKQRIEDLNTLNHSLKGIEINALRNTIYISVPAEDSKCTNLNLPSLPEEWSYSCSSPSTYKNSDGSGWIPLNISSHIPALPIDPINNVSTMNYYSFVPSSDGYVITAVFNSEKYLEEMTQKDGGIDSLRYEIGTNIKIWSEAQGLVGYWPMLSDLNQAIKIEDGLTELSDNNLTILIWVNLSQQKLEAYEFLYLPPFVLYAYNTHPTLDILASVYGKDQQYFSKDMNNLTYDEWHQIGFTYKQNKETDSIEIANILDGKIDNTNLIKEPNIIEKVSFLVINARSLHKGKIGPLTIYKKSLTQEEIYDIYNQDLFFFKNK